MRLLAILAVLTIVGCAAKFPASTMDADATLELIERGILLDKATLIPLE